MLLAIIILAHISFIGDWVNVFTGEKSNLLFSTATVVLLAWYVSTAWGITYCAVWSIMLILAIVGKFR
jgi:phosphohistidine phosphatase SixA